MILQEFCCETLENIAFVGRSSFFDAEQREYFHNASVLQAFSFSLQRGEFLKIMLFAPFFLLTGVSRREFK